MSLTSIPNDLLNIIKHKQNVEQETNRIKAMMDAFTLCIIPYVYCIERCSAEDKPAHQIGSLVVNGSTQSNYFTSSFTLTALKRVCKETRTEVLYGYTGRSQSYGTAQEYIHKHSQEVILKSVYLRTEYDDYT